MTTLPSRQTQQAQTPTHSTKGLALYQSSIGKKILTGLTGIGLVSFIIAHMLGNLILFFSADAYNHYAHWLESVAPLLWSVELVLVMVIVIHAGLGIQIYLNKRRARVVPYETYQSAGAPSQQTLSSRTMIWSGITLALFIVWHLATFKFGPRYPVSGGAIAEPEPMRDLADLVITTFHDPVYLVSYTLFLGLLSLHLRHGIWSALQSLGLLGSIAVLSVETATKVSLGLAIIITLGFLSLPWAIYLGWIG